VEVHRLVDNHQPEDGTAEVAQFVAEVKVRCHECGADFGFRGPLGGHSYREPRCAVDAKTIHLPLMPPAELELAGPLPVMARGEVVFEVGP
jgi:hypothetical protein